MKTLYLIKHQYDSGLSDRIERELRVSKLPFKSLTYLIDPLPWSTISAVPCVIVDVDGQIDAVEEQRYNRPYNHQSLIDKFTAAPDTKPTAPPTPDPESEVIKLLRSIDTRLSALETISQPKTVPTPLQAASTRRRAKPDGLAT